MTTQDARTLSRSARQRVAILGIHLEANAFAPPTTREDFAAECWEEGERITELARRTSNLPLEVPGFYARMDATGPWVPIPIVLAAAQPGGPIVQHVFDEFMDCVVRGLEAALPLDGVYVCSHGGSSTTEDDDNDGTLVAAVRKIVGSKVPVVVTHDLHCNVSELLVDSADALIAYRTNPHVDHRERAAEAADLQRLMFSGVHTAKAFIRMPIAPPGVTMLTSGGPFADLINLGRRLSRPPVLNISVTGGFIMTDLPKCGITINVTTAGDQAVADKIAREIAQAAWAGRHRYVREFLPIDKAVLLARDASQRKILPILLADVADNPGGGARGNTTWMIEALHTAGIKAAVVALFADKELARDAHAAGQGGRMHAVFNRVESQYSKRFECPVTVVFLSDGFDVGRRGRDAGRQINLGSSALLRLDGSGLLVAVTSLREQPCDPRHLEMFGVDIRQFSCVVLKSRGHFRAGFDEFFGDAQIHELDTLGLTSNVLQNFKFRKLSRPLWPLDVETTWSLPVLEN